MAIRLLKLNATLMFGNTPITWQTGVNEDETPKLDPIKVGPYLVGILNRPAADFESTMRRGRVLMKVADAIDATVEGVIPDIEVTKAEYAALQKAFSELFTLSPESIQPNVAGALERLGILEEPEDKE